ncbi:MAG: hypothetical protein EPO27_05060 [Betaproteobacteria bacterium]|nr:MAG: hypothetical protein EPO27_05060 [Betaproteobacteria bacterium]
MLAALSHFRVAVAALLLLPAMAQAQGLGRLTVHSALGQPLRAEVAIVSMQSAKDGGLHGSIATPDTYREMGIAFDPVLFSIRVAVEDRAGGPVLMLTSTRPMKEPFLEVVIVLQSASGRLIRNYTVLFDSR